MGCLTWLSHSLDSIQSLCLHEADASSFHFQEEFAARLCSGSWFCTSICCFRTVRELVASASSKSSDDEHASISSTVYGLVDAVGLD